MTNPLLAPVWILGLVALLRDPRLRPWRPLAVGSLLFVAVYVVVGGKPYYAFGWYPVLFGAGLVRIARWRVDRAGGALRASRLLPVVALAAVPTVLLLLPVWPVSALRVTGAVNEDALETVAWPEHVAQVRAVLDGLPGLDRAAAVVVTRNYGEAGAVAGFGGQEVRGRGVNGDHSYWVWGAPPRE